MNSKLRSPRRDHAIQGCLRDAWLIAALGAVAGHRPDAIRKLLRKHPSGAAHIELHQVTLDRRTADWVPTGQPIVLELSPEVPVNPYSPELSYFADTCHSKSVWPALLEKAFAEIDGSWSSARREAIPERGYERLDVGGNEWEAAEILAQLTGSRAGIIDWDRAPDRMERIEITLRYLLSMKRPVLIGTKPRIDAQGLSTHGLYPQHAYEIIRAEKGSVDLRNPWGVLHVSELPISSMLECTRGMIATLKD